MRRAAIVLLAMATLPLGASGAQTRANESIKSPIVLCGVHTRANPQTLQAMRAAHIDPCATPQPRGTPHPRRMRVVTRAVPRAAFLARMHATNRRMIIVPHIRPSAHLVFPVVPPAPTIAEVQTSSGNTLSSGTTFGIAGANFIANGMPPTVTMTFTDCRGTIQLPLTNVSAANDLVIGQIAPYQGWDQQQLITNASSVPVTITVTNAAGESATTALSYSPWINTEIVDLAVLFIPDLGLPTLTAYSGLTASNATIDNNGMRWSDWPAYLGGMGSKGDDVLGTNVQLVNGWHVVGTKFLQVQSKSDPSDGSWNNVTDIPARGARFEAPLPTNGSLATRVHWWYEANQSILYEIEWTLEGPVVYRALSTEATIGTPCEQ